MKHTNVHNREISEDEEREKGVEKYLKKLLLKIAKSNKKKNFI